MRDSGLFRQVKTEFTESHFYYHVDYGQVELRCVPCAAPGYSSKFAERMQRYAERSRAVIEVRRAAKRARGLKIGAYDPGADYLNAIRRIGDAYREAAK